MTGARVGEYEIYALRYAGPFTGSGALVLWLREWEEIFERYYFFWCIKGDGGPIVVDCGVAPALAEERALKGYVNPVAALKSIGVDAAQVRKVIITHMHWDHCSGIAAFPKATIYVQESEFNFWVKDPVAKKPVFETHADKAAIDYLAGLEGSDRLVLVNGDEEFMPGIELLLSPGHTTGLQAVAVRTRNGTAILGSDCAHFFRNYTEEWPSAFIVDLVAWMKTYDKLKARVSSPDLLFPGHDPLLMTNFPKVSEYATRLA